MKTTICLYLTLIAGCRAAKEKVSKHCGRGDKDLKI